MELRDVEAIPLAHPLAEGRALGGSRGKTASRFATLVRVETADGSVGWGEAFAPPRTVATLIDEEVADRVRGRDPRALGGLAEEFYTKPYHFGGGPFLRSAVSGVDVALWDLVGREVGASVGRLLGGRVRETLVPYASTGYFTTWEQDVEAPLGEAADEGFTAAKIKIGGGVDDDVDRVRAAREALGEDAHLMVDYNGNYAPKRVVRSVSSIAEYGLTWVEEPVPAENRSGYRELSRRLDVPLAAGEAHYSRFEFKRLIDDRLVDVVQPNLGRCGGLTEARFLARLATTENVAVRPHVWNSGVGVAAAVQFAASVPRYPHNDVVPEPFLFEFDRSENPLRSEVLVDPFDPSGGTLAVPDGPGLGVQVDAAGVERYRVDA